MNLFPKRKKKKEKRDRLQSLSNFIWLLSLKHLSESLSKAYSKGLKKIRFYMAPDE